VKTYANADAFFSKAKTWQKELKKLRTIILGCGLAEELKWSKPTYTVGKSNVVILIPLKEKLALMFCKGALLKDSRRLLETVGQSQASRWIKFGSLAEIAKLESALKAYIREAVKNQKAGLDVTYKQTSDYPVPDELKAKLSKSPRFKAAFEALTPGRQRGYLLYFAGAKQSKTREARIEKCTPQIMRGKGIYD
jgi:uncharacterized protein YdeI (YjbR/CyaY-like superfamily)